jgi:C4-dicarboxylate-specific signal transduction histidine kinase
MLRTLKRTCRRLARALRRGDSHAEVAATDISMLSGHEDIRTISTRLTAVKSEIDRSLYELRDWSRELEQRLGPMQDELVRTRGLRSLGETIGGLAHNFNNSLAAIVSYAELLMRERGDEAATTRQLAVIRQIALEAGSSVRHLQECGDHRSRHARHDRLGGRGRRQGAASPGAGLPVDRLLTWPPTSAASSSTVSSPSP